MGKSVSSQETTSDPPDNSPVLLLYFPFFFFFTFSPSFPTLSARKKKYFWTVSIPGDLETRGERKKLVKPDRTAEVGSDRSGALCEERDSDPGSNRRPMMNQSRSGPHSSLAARVSHAPRGETSTAEHRRSEAGGPAHQSRRTDSPARGLRRSWTERRESVG